MAKTRSSGTGSAAFGARADFQHATSVLRRVFGLAQFRPPQAAVIRAVLGGRDVLAILPTGSGKSLCFQIPALISPGLTVAVTPLVSLMEDQVARARARAIPAAALHSGQEYVDVRRTGRMIARGDLKLLYVSPERLETRSLLRLLGDAHISRIAVDEAHCVSEWGHDFRPAYRKIADFRRRAGWPQCVALTATATPRTRDDVSDNLGLRRPTRLVWPVDRPNLRWDVLRERETAGAARKLIQAVLKTPGATILYTLTRAEAVRLADALRRRGIAAAAYHAGMPAAARQAAQEAFLAGRLRAMCATTAFGMGIDHPSVRLVGHLGSPASLEAYVQEAGRGGRDGDPARCLLLARSGDEAFHRAQWARSWPPARALRALWRFMTPGEPLDQRCVAEGIPGLTADETLDAIAFLDRCDAVRRTGDAAWIRGPDPLWRRVATSLEWGLRRCGDRLTGMRAYVNSPRCRRRTIARYFVDVAPSCGGCDRCNVGPPTPTPITTRRRPRN